MFNFFKSKSSAPVARERLKVLLAHERSFFNNKPDLIAVLREEILAVIRKHVQVDADKVRVTTERDAKISTLSVDIEIPMDTPTAAAA
jgi:cell division topological specificity factor